MTSKKDSRNNASELDWSRTLQVPVIHPTHLRPACALSPEKENSIPTPQPCFSVLLPPKTPENRLVLLTNC